MKGSSGTHSLGWTWYCNVAKRYLPLFPALGNKLHHKISWMSFTESTDFTFKNKFLSMRSFLGKTRPGLVLIVLTLHVP